MFSQTDIYREIVLKIQRKRGGGAIKGPLCFSTYKNNQHFIRPSQMQWEYLHAVTVSAFTFPCSECIYNPLQYLYAHSLEMRP